MKRIGGTLPKGPLAPPPEARRSKPTEASGTVDGLHREGAVDEAEVAAEVEKTLAAIGESSRYRPPPTTTRERGYFSDHLVRADGRISGRRFSGEIRQKGLAEAAAIGVKVVQGGPEAEAQLGPRAAGFNYKEGVIYLQTNATRYEFEHELTHAKQWAEIGEEAYRELGTWARELHVFDTLMEDSSKLNRYEFEHARNYIEVLARRHGQPVPFAREGEA